MNESCLEFLMFVLEGHICIIFTQSSRMSKNIIITGASSGIGKATMELLLAKGHNITAVSRNISKLEKSENDRLLLISADVRSYYDAKKVVDLTIEKFGIIDVLINNAGLGYFDNLAEGSIEHWQEMVDINIKGVLNYLHAALPALLDSKGHIINVGSVASHLVFPSSGVYCATKHAVYAITESIRMDLKGKVKATLISPGQVDTNFINITTNEEIKSNLREVFKSGLRPETVAGNILYAIESPAVISEIIVRPNLL